MKRSPLSLLAVVLLGAAACGQAPAPKAALKPVPDPVLQPSLQPPRQPVVIPAPEPVAVRKAASRAAKEDANRLLADRVKRALEDESHIHAAAIDVTAAGGTVTLWGTAATDDERARATRVAARIVGVKWVNNKLVIASGS
jgi:hypothetical protein